MIDSDKIKTQRMRRILFSILFLFSLQIVIPVSGSTDDSAGQRNLLVNPDWKDGTNGWKTEVNTDAAVGNGKNLLCTTAWQEISVDGFRAGQVLKLCGRISVAAEDTTQELVRIGIEFLSDDREVILSDYEEEAGTKAVYHEIKAQIPPDAATIRVVLSIFKQDKQENSFSFSNLCLTEETVLSPGGEDVSQEELSAGKAEGYKCIYTNISYENLRNDPEEEMEFSLDMTVHVAYLTTFHWNDGFGDAPGTIYVYEDGQLTGSWPAQGRSRSGVSNVFWDAKTDFTIHPDHYYRITDSSGQTWSWNSESGGFGMLEIYGTVGEADEYTVLEELRYCDIKITIDDVYIRPEDQNGSFAEPFIVEDSIFIPYRTVAKLLALKADYDDVKKQIRLTKAGVPKGTGKKTHGHEEIREEELTYKEIEVVLDGKKLILLDPNGQEMEPFEYKGDLYLPIMSLADPLGLRMEWNGFTNTLNIITPGPEPTFMPAEPSPEPSPEPTPSPGPETKPEPEEPTGETDGKESGTTPQDPTGSDPEPTPAGKAETETKTNPQSEESVQPEVEEDAQILPGASGNFNMDKYMGKWYAYNEEGSGTMIRILENSVTVYTQKNTQVIFQKAGSFAMDPETQDLLFYEHGYAESKGEGFSMRFHLKDDKHMLAGESADTIPDPEDTEYVREEKHDIDDYLGAWYYFVAFSEQDVRPYLKVEVAQYDDMVVFTEYVLQDEEYLELVRFKGPYRIDPSNRDLVITISEYSVTIGDPADNEGKQMILHLMDERHLQLADEDGKYSENVLIRSSEDYEEPGVDPSICPQDFTATMYLNYDFDKQYSATPCKVKFEKGYMYVTMEEGPTNSGTRSTITIKGKVTDKYEIPDASNSMAARYHGSVSTESSFTVGNETYSFIGGSFTLNVAKKQYLDKVPAHMLSIYLWVRLPDGPGHTDKSFDMEEKVQN